MVCQCYTMFLETLTDIAVVTQDLWISSVSIYIECYGRGCLFLALSLALRATKFEKQRTGPPKHLHNAFLSERPSLMSNGVATTMKGTCTSRLIHRFSSLDSRVECYVLNFFLGSWWVSEFNNINWNYETFIFIKLCYIL